MIIPREPVRVLLVDDSTVVCERFGALLETLEGVKVVATAGDAKSGWQRLREQNPDVLVLDLEMPGESGLALLKAVRAEYRSLIVIVLTIHDDPQLRRACLDLGADYFFNKAAEFEGALTVCAELGKARGPASGREPLLPGNPAGQNAFQNRSTPSSESAAPAG